MMDARAAEIVRGMDEIWATVRWPIVPRWVTSTPWEPWPRFREFGPAPLRMAILRAILNQ